MLVPFRTITQSTSTEHILDDLIDSFSFLARLGMIG
jgi:hypothetical protein